MLDMVKRRRRSDLGLEIQIKFWNPKLFTNRNWARLVNAEHAGRIKLNYKGSFMKGVKHMAAQDLEAEGDLRVVWEIVNANAFYRGGAFMDRDAPRFYLSREKAEAAAQEIASRAHEDNIEDHTSRFEDPEYGDCYTQEERAWWLSSPPLTVHKTESKTFYCCGDPEWDSRDRRGEAYGWVARREVVT